MESTPKPIKRLEKTGENLSLTLSNEKKKWPFLANFFEQKTEELIRTVQLLIQIIYECRIPNFYHAYWFGIIKENLASTGIEPATFALLARRSNQLS